MSVPERFGPPLGKRDLAAPPNYVDADVQPYSMKVCDLCASPVVMVALERHTQWHKALGDLATLANRCGISVAAITETLATMIRAAP